MSNEGCIIVWACKHNAGEFALYDPNGDAGCVVSDDGLFSPRHTAPAPDSLAKGREACTYGCIASSLVNNGRRNLQL
eukprot:1151925-Pelagomonas_calceolata.AAC.4